jgi:uncharacterized low-complexity protein
VVVWTDIVTLKYFATQSKLSSKQVMARHIGFVQCGHSTQVREGKCGARCAKSKTLTESGVCGRNGTSKRSSISKPP